MEALITRPLPGAARDALMRRLAEPWRRAWRSEEEKFLLGATGLEDLERRLKSLERAGLPPVAAPHAESPWRW